MFTEDFIFDLQRFDETDYYDDTDTDTDTDTDYYDDYEGDTDTDSDTDSDYYDDYEGDTDTDSDSDSDYYDDYEGDADTDTDSDADADTDTDSDCDTDSDTDTDTDADDFNHEDYVTINGSDGDDEILNDGKFVTINAYKGNDYIENNVGDSAIINGGAGNDFIYNVGNYVTISGGAGDDTIVNDDGTNTVFKYTAGDGNDFIDGFNDTSTLQIGDGSGTYSTQKSGEDIIVTVGKGKITLSGAANLDEVNINGKEDTKKVWKLSGTTATYGTSSKTLVTVKGVKSTSGLSISGKVVTIAASALNKSKVTISDGYTLALASDVTKTSTKKAWSLSGTTATYNQTTAAGYSLAKDSKSISYTKKATKTLATVSGVKSTSGLSISGKVVTIAADALNKKKVTISDGYTLALAKDVTKTSAKKSWSLSKTTATYNQTTAAGYTLAKDSKSISYTKKTTETLATLKGVKSLDGISISGTKITLSKTALGTSDVTVSKGYTLALAKNTKPTSKKAWSLSGTTATYKQTTSAGYTLSDNARTASYTKKATNTLATVNGVKSKSGFKLDDDTIKLATSSLSKKVSVSSEDYGFEFASDYKSAKITGSGSDDTITSAGKKITITGGKGNDYIISKGKNSTINAGAGNDTIVNSGANVTILGGKGNDSLTGGKSKEIYVYAQGDGNDVITNYGEEDRISIKSGAVDVSTSGKNIILTVGKGDNKGKITLQKAKGKTITYIVDDEEFTYSKGDIKYNADGTAATLKATYSKDVFEPSNYSDYSALVTIDGAEVNHALKITGNKQANKITGTSNDDTLLGGTGGDTLLGGGGNDELYGEKGNDSLIGGKGDDSLWGGKGSDTLIGGAGNDIFCYSSGDGNDTITDYSPGVDKVMILSFVNVGNPETDNSGDVTFRVGNGQILFQNGASKYIELVDKADNVLKKYNPR